MARIPYLNRDQMSEKTFNMFNRPDRGMLNIQRVMAHAEESVRHWGRLATSLMSRAKLDPRFREIAILRVATLCNCRYEWNQHEKIARRVGLTELEIEAIQSGDQSDLFAHREKAVLKYTDEVVKEVRASDETFGAIQSFLGNREIVELTLTITHWEMVAKCIESLGVDLQ